MSDKNRAHKQRLKQARELLGDVGYVELEDGSWKRAEDASGAIEDGDPVSDGGEEKT